MIREEMRGVSCVWWDETTDGTQNVKLRGDGWVTHGQTKAITNDVKENIWTGKGRN